MANERRLVDCYRLLEETGDAGLCVARHPGLAGDIEAYRQIRSALVDLVPEPHPLAMAAGRRDLLAALAERRQGLPLARRLSYAGIGGGFVALTLMALAGLGVSAATGHGLLAPVERILRDVGSAAREEFVPGDGAGGEHGAAVSDTVQDARESATPDAGQGVAVSAAACAGAHDRSTLPPPAQEAPGQEGQTPASCETAAAADGSTEATATATATASAATVAPSATEQPPATPTPTAGAASDDGDSDGGAGPPNGKTPGPPNKTPGPPAGKTPPGQQQNHPPGQAQ